MICLYHFSVKWIIKKNYLPPYSPLKSNICKKTNRDPKINIIWLSVSPMNHKTAAENMISSSLNVKAKFWHHPDLQDEFKTSSWPPGWIPDIIQGWILTSSWLMSRLNFLMQQDIYWLWNVFFNDNIISGMYQQMQRSNQKVDLVENNDKGKVIYGQEPPSRESTTTECRLNYQLLAVIY